MIRIGILGDIGSGKSFVAKSFGYPVFNADNEVGILYRKNKKIFIKLNKALPKHITEFPIKKQEITRTILANKNSLKKIIKIIHPEIRKRMNIFIKKNKKKKLIVLDIPLLLENKINRKKDILIFVESKKEEILKRLKKRKNFDKQIINKFRKIQLPLDYKKKKSEFIIKNNFTNRFIKKQIKYILEQIH
ncbi:dephospho-CoA kinase [Candidatus Pelagibacter sp.]|uniref:dephospho-CoA kinase n=1 Tax=Candidatus Pelagibacter sp. TaxID=2024849 RepID=UPI003F8379DC